MLRDLQDHEAAPAGICVLIEDHYEVLKQLVDCSNDVESGGLEAFENNEYYKAYLLNLSNKYYSTKIQIQSFDTLSSYLEWYAKGKWPIKPSAIFICVDIRTGETELQEYLDRLEDSGLDQIDTRSLLLFGLMPYSKNNVEHPKARLIQKCIERHFVETVRFEPNEEELLELEDNHEIYGIKRVWELLCVADWPTKTMKKGVGRFDSTAKPNGIPSSASQKCTIAQLANDHRSSRIQQDNKSSGNRNLTDGMKPTREDEIFIYNFLMNTKKLPEPNFKISKIPDLSMKYLMTQRERALKNMGYARDDRLMYSAIPASQFKNYPLFTEATLADRSNLNTQMSIINTVKQFEPEKESRAGSTSINLASDTKPVTTEKVSIVQQSKRKKKSKKTPEEPAEQPTSSDSKVDKETRDQVERIFERVYENEEAKTLEEWVENWSNVKDKPPSDEKVHVANQLTKSYLKQSASGGSEVSQQLGPEVDKSPKMKIKPETKKDK